MLQVCAAPVVGFSTPGGAANYQSVCSEEPALHSVIAGKEDIYREKRVHLVCVDKPGIGGTSMAWGFSVRRDWPRVVAAVADTLGVSKYVPHLLKPLHCRCLIRVHARK